MYISLWCIILLAVGHQLSSNDERAFVLRPTSSSVTSVSPASGMAGSYSSKKYLQLINYLTYFILHILSVYLRVLLWGSEIGENSSRNW